MNASSASLTPEPTPPAPDGPAQRADRVRRQGTWLAGAGALAGVLWLALAPLDEGVPASGSVVVDAKRKAVQHMAGGIVRAVLVGEGSRVQEGQPLMRLDDVAARAVHEAVLQRYLSLRARETRLVAERDGATRWPGVPAGLPLPADDVRVQLQWSAQQALWAQRRAALAAELAALAEGQAAHRADATAAQAAQGNRVAALGAVQAQLDGLRELARDGYAPLNQVRELERQAAEAQATLAGLQGQRERAQRGQAEAVQRTGQRRSEFQRDVQAELAEVYRDLQAEGERLRAAREDLDRTEIRAPAAGQVVGLAVQNVGAVLQPAQRIADIVPAHEDLLLEVRIDPTLVDRVRPGLPVDVRFNAFSGTPGLVVPGRLQSVSADVLADNRSGQTFYLGRVAITDEGRAALGDRQLQAGMPVEVLLRTGERSLLAYWAQPLLRRLGTALREP